jgi:hypothetical protein
MIKYLLIVANFFLIKTAVAQSPWVREQGAGYFQMGAHIIPEYKSLFLDNGDDFYTSRYVSDNTVQAYFEYGVTDDFTMIYNLPYKFVATGDVNKKAAQIPTIEQGTVNGFGNMKIGFKHNILSKEYVAAGQLNIGIPTSIYDSATGLRTGYDTWQISPLLSFGKGGSNYYIFGYGGMDFRLNEYSYHLKTGIEAGYEAFDNIWPVIYFHINESLDNGTVQLPDNNYQTGLYVNDQEYFAWGAKIITELSKKYGFVIGADGSFSGHMVAHSPLITGTVYYKW